MKTLSDSKTVILLNREAKFADDSNQTFDINLKEGAKIRKVGSARKTCWSWCLEGLFEIHRVLSDVCPLGDKLIRFALADFMGRMLDSDWGDQMLKRQDLANLIGSIEEPNTSQTDINTTGGITMAIEALAQETNKQKAWDEILKKKIEERMNGRSELDRFRDEVKGTFKDLKGKNRGSLIVFTRLKTDDEIEQLEQEVAKIVDSKNEMARSPSNKIFCPISHLNLFIVNMYAVDEKCDVSTRPLTARPSSSVVHTWVISRKATDMMDMIHSLLVDAFGLASTTIAKIPMKEENKGNATSSSNYDVELFHQKSVHGILRKLEVIKKENSRARCNEGVSYETVRLTWATAPKSKWNLYPTHCGKSPCSPAKAFSRPSICLTQFVMDGRNVLLYLNRSGPVSKFPCNVAKKYLISHMLIANRGRFFIHEIDFVPRRTPGISLMESERFLKPSEEKVNIAQFSHIFKQMKLKVKKPNLLEENKEEDVDLKLDKIRTKFLRISRNLPLFEKDTFLFQAPVLKNFEPMVSIITKKVLSDVDVETCNALILKLLQKRDQRSGLVSASAKVSICRLMNVGDNEEQMRVALAEMARYLSNYVDFSARHLDIYKMFMKTLGLEKILNMKIRDVIPVKPNIKLYNFMAANRPIQTKRNEKQKCTDSSKLKRPFFDDDFEFSNKIAKMEASYCAKNEDCMRKGKKKTEESREPEFKMNEKKVEDDDINKVIYIPPPAVQVNIMEMMCDRIEKHVAKKRRDFVGRELYGETAKLYPNLNLNAKQSTPPIDPELKSRGRSGTPPVSKIRGY